MIIIKREKWKNRYVYVARDKGKLVTWKNIKGSLQTLGQVKDIFKLNKTFSLRAIFRKEKLVNVTEFQKLGKSKIVVERGFKKVISPTIKLRAREKQTAQYVVTGILKNGERVSARSQRLGSKLAKDKGEAKKRAWNSFYERLDQALTGDYDADDGRDLFQKEIAGVEEGWVYYR